MVDKRFVGTWRLVSWENRRGEVSHPFGRDAIGYIMYGAEGYMSVAISTATRPRFTSSDPFGGTEEERARAEQTYVSYCGRYEVRGNAVLHHIEASLFPNWVGGTQVRFFAFEGDRLTLNTAPTVPGGAELRGSLIWERVS